jgi:hypothetical protein
VPWEIGDGTGHWVAVFDEATEGRRETLEGLLVGAGSYRAAPPLFGGWSARLVLNTSDPICFFPALPGLVRSATGLFDSNTGSLAVVAGETLHCFGHPSCCQRLSAFLSEPDPLDLTEVTITAAPHGSFRRSPQGSARFDREYFDLFVTEPRQ